ncbi:MAG: type VI secretion system baseplate subunit TssE [Azoarcus sp.]|jgi:type VI secretion system protein ImpF|nr:type VI secretion system baseplate subunit TssE [Azoarcus sp.]
MSSPGRANPRGDLFLPALLDRLVQSGSAAMTRNEFRKTALRDLAWLLNCTNLDKHLPMDDFPRARFSVLNFGIPPLAGSRFTKSELKLVAQRIEQAIAHFEPRILPESLKVTIAHDMDVELYNYARFRIEAAYWFEPYPIDMVIRARWDMETGGVEVREET